MNIREAVADRKERSVNERGLPHSAQDESWNRVYIQPEQKAYLLGQAVLLLILRPRLSRTASNLHGLISSVTPLRITSREETWACGLDVEVPDQKG